MQQRIKMAIAGAALVGGGLAAQMCQAQIAPPQVTFAPQSEAVPFELFRGSRIFVPARINGHDTEVLLDTGASATTLDRGYARSIGLPEGMKISGRGAGGAVDAELVSGVTVEIGGMRLEKLSVGVLDLAPVSRGLGRPLTVVLGRDFFNSAVVSIDWAANRLQIRQPQQFTPGPGAVELTLKRKGPFNTIPVAVAGGSPIEALLDLGSAGTLILPPTYWSGRAELANLRSGEGRVGGVGGMNSARSVTLPVISLAGRSFANVPGTLSNVGNDHEATQMANLGVGLLKQFKVDLDLGRDRIYLTARSDSPPFERDRSGAGFDFVGDRLKVAFVSPRGPAAEAGLKVGDEVASVDGRAVTADYYRSPDWTRGPSGRSVRLKLANGSEIAITLRDYF